MPVLHPVHSSSQLSYRHAQEQHGRRTWTAEDKHHTVFLSASDPTRLSPHMSPCKNTELNHAHLCIQLSPPPLPHPSLIRPPSAPTPSVVGNPVAFLPVYKFVFFRV
jgi:hypothetical protein